MTITGQFRLTAPIPLDQQDEMIRKFTEAVRSGNVLEVGADRDFVQSDDGYFRTHEPLSTVYTVRFRTHG